MSTLISKQQGIKIISLIQINFFSPVFLSLLLICGSRSCASYKGASLNNIVAVGYIVLLQQIKRGDDYIRRTIEPLSTESLCEKNKNKCADIHCSS